tara:strand:- start:2240 stop:3163 length:924 start_codon:yes stop_codon:yes gene_type:complete
MNLGDCNYEIDHDDDSIPDSGVVYCNIEHIDKFFEKCNRTDNKYVVVSAFSDYGVAIQEEYPVAEDMVNWVLMNAAELSKLGYSPLVMAPRCDTEKCKISDKYSVRCYSNTYSTFSTIPKNVVKWFVVNSRVRDERIISIPLGVGKDAPQDICTTVSDPILVNGSDRVNWAYVNWQDNTLERLRLKEALLKYNPEWTTIVTEPKPYLEYLKDLSKHSFAFCPEGNGVDCYRVLECLYCGCIPIVKNEIAYDYLDGLPHLKVDSWAEITVDLLKEKLKEVSMMDFSMDKISIDYWQEQINKYRGLTTN